MIKKFILTVCTVFIFVMPANCNIFQGGVQKQQVVGANRVLDSQTNAPISGAKITLPQTSFETYTNGDGVFDLNADINGQTVLSVEKEVTSRFR